MLACDPQTRFADGSSVLAALRELTIERALQQPLPPTAAQAIGRTPTQRALPLQPPGRPRWRGSAMRLAPAAGIAVIALAVIALAVVYRIAHRSPATPPAPPPPGMVRIDVGTIDVGRNPDEIERECREIGSGCDLEQIRREVPRTRVRVPPFFLDKDEVTNEELAAMLNTFQGTVVLVEDEDSHYPRYVRRNAGTGSQDLLVDLDPNGGIEYVGTAAWKKFRARAGRERLPVSQVSWHGATLFCESRGKRLPTDVEWEAAARGGEDRRFPWGNDEPRCGGVAIPNDGKVPMSGACPASETVAVRAVGTAAQDITPDGVRDLGGNVTEWTSSLFITGRREASLNPAAPDAPRVLRGGSWGASLRARSSGRGQLSPSIMGLNVGFRCASDAGDARE